MTHITKSSVTVKKVLFATTLVIFGIPQFAHAGGAIDSATAKTVHVQVADLNLSHSAGLDTLYTRLSNASRAVCGNQSDLKVVGSLKQLRINNECYENTMAKALAEVNFPSVAQASAQ